MLVEELTPSAHGEWDAFVDGRRDATCYHLRLWKEVAERALRLRAPHLIARDAPSGAIRGVLPLFFVDNPAGGYVTSGLFGAYGPLLADDLAARALLDEAFRFTRSSGAAFLSVKASGIPPSAPKLERRDDSVFATLPLLADPEAQWRGFRDKIRNAIRKAQRSELEPRFGRAGFDGFYDVLAENMHIKGTPIYGTPFLRTLLDQLRERGEVLTLWRDGRCVSGALIAEHAGVAYVPFASSRPSSLRWNPNNLLYWEIIQRACLRGMRVLDCGRSAKDSSTLAFKSGWGAVTQAQPTCIYTARGKPPSLDAHSPSVERLAGLWRRLPRPLADALGPSICRRFLV